MAGGHTSEKRWYENQNPNGNEGVAPRVQAMSQNVLAALLEGEEAYQEMLELFDFAGGTTQDVADQLFFEFWSTRSTPGVQAVITVDVAAGVVSNPIVIVAGTNYVDGTGFVLRLFITAGHGGTGNAEMTYDVVSGAVTNAVVTIGGSGYNDGTNIVVADTPAAPPVFETQANAEELAKTTDMAASITSIHELFEALTNVVVTQKDRQADLRRMS